MDTPPLQLDVIEFLDDQTLLEEYHKTDGAPGNRLADDLLAEIERRNLGI